MPPPQALVVIVLLSIYGVLVEASSWAFARRISASPTRTRGFRGVPSDHEKQTGPPVRGAPCGRFGRNASVPSRTNR